MRISKKERKRKKKLQMRNKRLIKKYYWLIPRNVWTDQIPKDYDYTWIDWWDFDSGWGKAFGWQYLKEVGDAINKSGQKHFRIWEIKEKFGQLRVYTSGTTREVHDIIDKYEKISENVCYHCGKEAPMTDDGWMLPKCFKCFCKFYRRREQNWNKYHSQEPVKFKTDEELREIYEEIVCDKPDENGEYHIPNSYRITRSANGEWQTIDIDISETAENIRKRISKFA